jgi:N-acetylglucosaminyldiphosphoundecaprenol N-acetyl-beta-D-mannosaminyltransferase
MTHTHVSRFTVLGLPVDAVSLADAVALIGAQLDHVIAPLSDYPQDAGQPYERRHRSQHRPQFAQIGVASVASLTTPRATSGGAGSLHASAHVSGARPASVWLVAPLNPEIVMCARRAPDLRAIIQRAPLVTADGMGIVWALRLRGVRLPERVTGVDLVEALAQRAAICGYRLFLLGATPGVAEAAGAALRRRHPGLAVVGAWAGSPDPKDDAEARRRIRAARPDVICVAYGSPAQERWIARVGPALVADRQQDEADGSDANDPDMARPRPIVAIGVGGALDLLAGRIPRAPLWMRRAGFEWLFRLSRQPWRWLRMLALPQFTWLALGEAWRAPMQDGRVVSDNSDTCDTAR